MSNTPKTFHKTIRLLQLVAERPGMTLAELSDHAGTPVATTHRLLRALEESELVRVGVGHTYRLGSACLKLGSAYLHDLDLRAEVHPALERLVAETGETAHLGILDGVQIVYVDKVETSHSVRMYSRVGATGPAHSTGMGKAILAWSDDSVIRRVVDAGLAVRTANTITNPERLAEELERIRVRGFSIDDIENEEGIRCVGAPIRGADGSVLGAISVAGPAARLTESKLYGFGTQVRDAAAAVSQTFGFAALEVTA